MSAHPTTRFELRCSPHAPAAARRLVRSALRSCASGDERGDLVADAELLVSELISNAVIHGQCDRTVCEIEVRPAGRVRIAVSDPGLSGEIRTRTADLGGTGGMGLHLVGRLATEWGQEHQPGRRTVWFELEP